MAIGTTLAVSVMVGIWLVSVSNRSHRGLPLRLAGCALAAAALLLVQAASAAGAVEVPVSASRHGVERLSG